MPCSTRASACTRCASNATSGTSLNDAPARRLPARRRRASAALPLRPGAGLHSAGRRVITFGGAPMSVKVFGGAVARLGVAACAALAAACTESGSAADEDAELLARGEYLMSAIVACGNCHSPRDENGQFIEGMELAGAFVIEEPGFR